MADIEKRCVECGKKVPTISETPLCSKDCQVDYAFRMVRNMSDESAWCPSCHQEFDSIRAVCYHHNKTHNFEIYRTKVCKNCGDLFEPSNTSNELKYCSERCFGEDNQVDLVQSQCKNCGELILHYPSQKRIFCSFECANEGEFHHNWSGGTSDIRNTKEYRDWRKEIHNKYDECNNCGSNDNLHAHHIIPVSDDKSVATSVDNGVLLYQKCHSEQHPNIPEKLFVGK